MKIKSTIFAFALGLSVALAGCDTITETTLPGETQAAAVDGGPGTSGETESLDTNNGGANNANGTGNGTDTEILPLDPENGTTPEGATENSSATSNNNSSSESTDSTEVVEPLPIGGNGGSNGTDSESSTSNVSEVDPSGSDDTVASNNGGNGDAGTNGNGDGGTNGNGDGGTNGNGDGGTNGNGDGGTNGNGGNNDAGTNGNGGNGDGGNDQVAAVDSPDGSGIGEIETTDSVEDGQNEIIVVAPVETENNEVIASMQTVYFDLDKSEIKDSFKMALQSNYEWIRANPGVLVQLEGHADERGSNEYNLALGERRGNSVLDYLLQLGASADQFTVVSFGEERPAETGSSETSYQKNRRVVFTLR